MSEISATFKNNYSESRHWVIVDSGRDPNSPPVIFDGYLAPNEVTSPLSLFSDDGIYGKVFYQRSDGPQQVVDSITEGSQVSMN
jgi:hypothetical protein